MLVEIGPGLGALTQPLLQLHGKLDVVELDRDVIPLLKKRCGTLGELRIHQQDALKTNYRKLSGGRRLRLLGNLPYNISTPLLFHLLEHADVIQDMHFMLQREVVARICALPGTRAYGRLTVMLARVAHAESLFVVAPNAFRPRPAVDSAVVRLTPHDQSPFDYGHFDDFALIVARAFNQRRKTLRNSLAGLISAHDMATVGIDPRARPEVLSPTQFGQLSLHYGRQGSG